MNPRTLIAVLGALADMPMVDLEETFAAPDEPAIKCAEEESSWRAEQREQRRQFHLEHRRHNLKLMPKGRR